MGCVRGLVAALLLAAVVACSSSGSNDASSGSTDAARVATAIQAFDRAVGAPQHVVSRGANVPPLHTITNVLRSAAGVRHLGDVASRSCEPTKRNVYAVTDSAALWRRFARVEGTVYGGRTTVMGRRVRLLAESGFDYDITAVLVTPTRDEPALLVVEGCS